MRRGTLTIWLGEAALAGWIEQDRDASRTYTDAAIEAVLLLKAVYRLPLCGVQGFEGSLLSLMGLALLVPHFSTLSRRQTGLEFVVPPLRTGAAIHLTVNSTGCKDGCPIEPSPIGIPFRALNVRRVCG